MTHKPPNCLPEHIKNNKEQPSRSEKSEAYKLTCVSYLTTDIGQTGRWFKIREPEHLRGVIKDKGDSNNPPHLLQENHVFTENFTNETKWSKSQVPRNHRN